MNKRKAKAAPVRLCEQAQFSAIAAPLVALFPDWVPSVERLSDILEDARAAASKPAEPAKLAGLAAIGEDSQLLTYQEAADLLRTCERTVRSWANEGLLKKVKLKAKVARVTLASVKSVIKRMTK